MFFGCPLVAIPSSLKLGDHAVYDKYAAVGLSRSSNHVSDEVSMSWCIQNREVSVRCLEMSCSNFNCYTPLLLLFGIIKDVSKLKSGLSVLYSLFFIFS